ncbi:unnamed protein product [Symbiodinium sp. CCMP2592]|nr:unnamed protein product [Symbiodinium sp. CCMP2592]
MLFWQPCQRIFLDVLCIDQIDQRRKSLGIFNMGAFLKSSDSLLVLWDPTYTSRLWCIFELSAFLRSKKDPKLIIRPTVLGPCYLLLSLALAVLVSSFGALPDGHGIYDVMLVQGCLFGVGFYPIVASFREYFRSIDTLQSTLEHFSVQDTTCHCCRMNHVTFRGDPMVCDRRVLLTCISAWFGSEDSFDAVVRHDVLDRLMQQLCNEFLSYWQLITVMLPMFFPFIDAASAQWHYVGRYHHAVGRELLRGLAWWLGIAPTILLICLRVAYLLRKRCRCDFLLNILVLLCIVALWLAGVGIENEYLRIHRRLGGIHKIEAMAALAATFLPLAGLLFYFLGSHPGYKVRPGTSGCTGSSTGVQELHVQNKGGEADVAPSPEKFGIITL